MQVVVEAAAVGLSFAVFLILLFLLFNSMNFFRDIENEMVKIGILGLAGGSLFHLLCEAAGVNRLYCSKGAACTN